MKLIKSTALNKHWLNFLILLKDFLAICIVYYFISWVGGLIIDITTSKHQVLKVVSVYETLFGFIIFLALMVLIIQAGLLNLNSPFDLLGNLKTIINRLIRKRRIVVLYGLLPSLHIYSIGMKSFSHYSFEHFFTQYLHLFLVLMIVNFFIAEGKERYLGNLFYASKSNSSATLETDFTPYGRKNISSFDEHGTKNLETSFTQGEVSLNVRFLLTPIKRKFVKTPEGIYHFVNSRYIDALFILHKIAMFFKGIAKAIKYKSPAALNSVLKNEGVVMTAKQRQIYALILLVLVSALFNYLYIWLGR